MSVLTWSCIHGDLIVKLSIPQHVIVESISTIYTSAQPDGGNGSPKVMLSTSASSKTTFSPNCHTYICCCADRVNTNTSIAPKNEIFFITFGFQYSTLLGYTFSSIVLCVCTVYLPCINRISTVIYSGEV